MTQEPMERILELKDKIKLLNIIIEEGKAYDDFRKSSFYQIMDRTLKAQKSVYEQDAYKASKSSLSNIGNYLGRMEMIDDLFGMFDKFLDNASQAVSDVEIMEEEIKDLETELNTPDRGTLDSGGAMG